MPSDYPTHPSSSGSAMVARQVPTLQPLGTHAHLDPIALHRPITLIGSRRTARIHLNSSNVSRAHAILVVTPDGCVIRDLVSREGTWIDGESIGEHRLSPGQVIKIAEFTFRYDDTRSPAKELRRPEPMALEVKSPAGQQEIGLRNVVTLIGKRSGSDVELPFPGVSTANTVIVRMDAPAEDADSAAGYLLYDLGGKGTLRNGQPVHRGRFRPEDKLKIGPATIRISEVAAEAPPAEVAEPAPVADEQDIALDEAITEDSGVAVAEDVLGDSHMMPAVEEPAAESEFGPAEAKDEALDEALEALEPETEDEALPVDVVEEAPPHADAEDLDLVEETPEAREEKVLDTPPAQPEEPAAVAPSPSEEQLAPQDLENGVNTASVEASPEMVEPREEAVEEATQEAIEQPEPDVAATTGALAGLVAERRDEGDEGEQADDAGGAALDDTLQQEFAGDAEEAPDEPLAVEPTDETFESALGALSDEESNEEAPAAQAGTPAEAPDEEAGDAIAEAEPEVEPEAVDSEVAAPEEPAVEMPDLSRTDFSSPETAEDEGEEEAIPLLESSPTTEPTAEPATEEAVAETPVEAVAKEAEEPGTDVTEEVVDRADETVATPARPTHRRKGNRRRRRRGGAAPVNRESEPESEHPAPVEDEAIPFPAAPAAEVVEKGEIPAPSEAIDAGEEPVADVSGELETRSEHAPGEAAPVAAIDDAVIDETPAEVPADATEPTPESAFPLDTAFEASERPQATSSDLATPSGQGALGSGSISDEQFLADLDALADDASDLVEKRDDKSLKDEAPAPGGSGPSTASGPDEQDEAEQPPAFIDEPSRRARAEAEAESESKGNDDDWRGDWRSQQSAFIGNATPLDLRGADKQEEDREPDRTPAPEDHAGPSQVERPERAPSHEASDRKSEISSTAPPPVAGEAPDDDRLELAPKPIPDQPAPPPRERPQRVGFGEPVAEIDEGESSRAAGPFSSAPVSQDRRTSRAGARSEDRADASDDGYYGPLDPSGAMPETSGLTGAADVFSLQEPVPADIPEFGTDPTTAPEEAGGVATATEEEAPEGEEVDSFLKTIREGVGNSSGITSLSGAQGDQAGSGRIDPAGLDDENALPEALVDGEMLPRGLGRAPGRRNDRRAKRSPARPARNGRAAVPATQLRDSDPALAGLVAADEPAPRRKFIFVPLLFALAVIAMIGAIVVIWMGLGPRTPVEVKLRYEIPATLSEDGRRSFQESQLRLLARPGTRAEVVDRLPEGVPRDYLLDPGAYSRFAGTAYWSSDETDTLVLARASTRPQEEIARLKAITATLYDQSRQDRRRLERRNEESIQLQRQIASLAGDLEDLTEDIEELAANEPEAPADPTALAAREAELRDEIDRLDTLWTSSDRRVAELKQELGRISAQDPLASDDELQTLRERLSEIESQLDELRNARSTAAGGPAGDWQEISTQLRAQPASSGEPVSATLSSGEQIAALAETLLTEVLPAHAKAAAAVEMAQQKARRLEAEQYDALLAEDAEAEGIANDIALRRRQLNAARADELTREIPRLEMSLRVLQNRLEMRQRALKVEAANAPEVAAATQELEAITEAETARMAQERDGLIETLDGLLATLEHDDHASLKATAIRAAIGAAAFEQARRSPLTAAVWLGAEGFEQPAEESEDEEEISAWGATSWISVESTGRQPTAVDLREEQARLERAIERREAEIRGEYETVETRLRQELAAAEATAAKAQREAQEARAELSALRANRQTDESQRQRLAELRSRKAEAEEKIQELQSELENVQGQLQTLAVPHPPSDADVVRSEVEDKRIEYIIYAMIAIAMCTLGGLFVLYRGS